METSRCRLFFHCYVVKTVVENKMQIKNFLINSNNAVRCVWFWRGKQFQFQFVNELNTWVLTTFKLSLCDIICLAQCVRLWVCCGHGSAAMEERTPRNVYFFYLLFGENKILMSCACAECIMENSFMAEPFNSLLFWLYVPQV